MVRQVNDEVITQKEDGEEYIEKLMASHAGAWQFVIIYHVAIFLIMLHLLGLYGGYIFVTAASVPTMVFSVFGFAVSMLGITAGAHRLWSHRAYKANTPLQIILAIFFLLSGQRSIITWVENHRLHHKLSDTDGDPHNATRGFFFSTVGWLAVEPHPEVVKEKKLIDLSDLLQNSIVKFQHEYTDYLVPLVGYIIPAYIPTLWGETLYVGFFVNCFRLLCSLIIAGLINSVAHIWGNKPIDKSAMGTQFLFIGILAFGEGFHNYHHVFPYDYRTSEVGDTKYNMTAMFINLMAKIGWAYDLKMASEDTVKSRVMRTGDGTDKYYS